MIKLPNTKEYEDEALTLLNEAVELKKIFSSIILKSEQKK